MDLKSMVLWKLILQISNEMFDGVLRAAISIHCNLGSPDQPIKKSGVHTRASFNNISMMLKWHMDKCSAA